MTKLSNIKPKDFMTTISQAVAEILIKDDLVMAMAARDLLNVSAYAQEIQSEVETTLVKKVKKGSIIAAIQRSLDNQPKNSIPTGNVLQSISAHANLEGMSFERTEETSQLLRDVYKNTAVSNKTYLTVTQGISEITVVAEQHTAQKFRTAMKDIKKIYDKSSLVGITVKFDLKFLQIPNLIYALTRRMALKSINIIEIVSTASELTFVIDRKDLQVGLEQLQKNI